MSNNAPDYENNLAFDPDINTMPRCDIEELKSQVKHLKDLQNAQDKRVEELEQALEKVEKQLKIAIKAINKGLTYNYILQVEVREDMDLYAPLYDKSEEKKELERQERALSKALEQIKELDK